MALFCAPAQFWQQAPLVWQMPVLGASKQPKKA
jgi:hypothetical protein